MHILTLLNPNDFQVILDRYTLGTYKSHKHFAHALSNTVYEIKTSKKIVIIKLFEHESKDVIDFQIKIMVTLEKNELSPKLFKTKSGKYVSYFKKPLIIQEYFEGKHVQTLSNGEAENFGTFLAQLHKSLRELDKGQRWKIGYQFRKDKCSYKAPNLNLNKEFESLNKLLKEINQNKLKIGVIHGDLSGSNILKNKKSKIMLCDWDDARKDYLVYDLAILIGNLMVKPNKLYKNQIKELLKSYQIQIKLNEDEKKAIYYFILYSLLSGLEYAAKQRKIHKEKKISKWMIKHEQKYMTIKNRGFKEFSSLF